MIKMPTNNEAQINLLIDMLGHIKKITNFLNMDPLKLFSYFKEFKNTFKNKENTNRFFSRRSLILSSEADSFDPKLRDLSLLQVLSKDEEELLFRLIGSDLLTGKYDSF